jgi:hypothetical protein
MTTATAVGDIEIRIAKVVGLGAADDELFQYVVLDEVAGDRHLAIAIGGDRVGAEARTAARVSSTTSPAAADSPLSLAMPMAVSESGRPRAVTIVSRLLCSMSMAMVSRPSW